MNYVFYKADIEYWLEYKRIVKIENSPSPILNNTDSFHKELVRGAFTYYNEDRHVELPQYEDISFGGRFRKSILKEKRLKDNLYHDHDGFLMIELLNDAIKRNDKKNIEYLRNYFDSHIFVLPFTSVPQSVTAIISIYLYKYTNDIKYKIFAEKMFSWLKKQDTDYGILYIQGMNLSLVDGIGMIVPFLIEYSKEFSSQEAYNLALKQIEIYTQFGCDKETGMPAFAYHIENPHVKVGCTNWGRGISWFVIGLSYIDINSLSLETQETIKHLNQTLIEIWNNEHHFGHFVYDFGFEQDLSAELPIICYLMKTGNIKLSEKDILEYSQFMHDGIMYHCSNGNSGAIKYGVAHGPLMLAQAFMLRLTKTYKNGN